MSTRPYDVRLYLPDLMEMVDNPLPSTAVLFVSSDTAHELPPNIVTSVVTLTVRESTPVTYNRNYRIYTCIRTCTYTLYK